MDNRVGGSSSTNGILMEDEIMDVPVVVPQPPQTQPPQSVQQQISSQYSTEQTGTGQEKQQSVSYTTPQYTKTLQSDSAEWKTPENTTMEGFSQSNAEYRPLYGKADIFEKRAGRHSNLFLGLIGALLGSALGAGIMIVLDTWGYWGCIGGVFIFYLILAGYCLLGHGVDKKGIIASSILTVVTIFIANQVGWTLWLTGQVEKLLKIELDFSEYLPRVRDYLKEINMKYLIMYYIDLVMSLIAFVYELVDTIRRVKRAAEYNNF